jgi:hypothetical protein
MLVINEPGHGHAEIIALGEDASGAVFRRGNCFTTIFSREISASRRVTVLDHAKCARTMKENATFVRRRPNCIPSHVPLFFSRVQRVVVSRFRCAR